MTVHGLTAQVAAKRCVGMSQVWALTASPTSDRNGGRHGHSHEYSFRGRSLGGIYEGSWDLTHDIPDGPTLVSPVERDPPQKPDATVVRWKPVAAPNGSPIIGYQVLVVHPESALDALPKITLDVRMPADSTSPAVPLLGGYDAEALDHELADLVPVGAIVDARQIAASRAVTSTGTLACIAASEGPHRHAVRHECDVAWSYW